jgi:hypothetical protein
MMHSSTFQYLAPTEEQKWRMESVREAANSYYESLDTYLPDGPDKTYAIRKLREVAMWANVAITRNPDGSPRAA